MVPESRSLDLVTTSCVLCNSDDSDACASGTDYEYDTTDQTFFFVSCRKCGHQYLNPRPSISELEKIYPSNYYSFTGPTRPLVARLQKTWESRKVGLYKKYIGEGPRKVLDVGCGDGRLLKLLKEFGYSEWKLVGLELDDEAVSLCQKNGFEAHSTRIEDFANEESQASKYDAVIMLQSIEHVEDPADTCEKVHRLLKPGGILIIETPNLGGLDYRLFSGQWWGHYHFPRHWNLFTQFHLNEMLSQKGLKVIHGEYLISTSAWIISHHNFFKGRGWPKWIWSFFSYQNPFLLAIAVLIDTMRIWFGGETSNQRVIAQKNLEDRDTPL